MPGMIKLSRTSLFFVNLAFFMCGCTFNVIYYPEKMIHSTPSSLDLYYEDVSFKASDGMDLSGWWVPAEHSRGTVLFCHGNGGNISHCLDTLRTGNRLGLNVFVFDYRGYGNSDGSPSEQGTYRDGEASWDYLVTARKIAPEKIVIWGRSLGGAVAARTAVRHQAGVLIVESAFTSVKDLVNDRFSWVPSWVMADYHYDTRESLGKVRVPVLVIHSPDDEIVPFQHGKALYDSIPGPKAFVEIKGSHNRGFIESRAVYESSIDEFISRYLVEGEAAIP